MNLADAAIFCWIGTLLVAAISDLCFYRIPNILPAILIILFVVLQILDASTDLPWENMAHFGAALSLGMVLFSKGWLGGGDAKLYAGIALWFPAVGALPFLCFTTISGLLLAVISIVLRMAGIGKHMPRQDRRIPYGLAIAAGGILNAVFLGWPSLGDPALL